MRMNDTLKNEIIDDLLRKRPKGPKGSNLHYTYSSEYCERRSGYFDTLKCNSSSYGYTDEVLHSLGLHDENACRNYVKNRWLAELDWDQRRKKKATLTRRTNRLWDRLGPSVKRITACGGVGIYSISAPYDRRLLRKKGYVYASSHEEAVTLANLFFPEISGGYAASFVEICGIDRLSSYNDKIQSKLDGRISELQSEIQRAQASLKMIKNHKTTLNVLMGHQVAANS